MKMILFFIALVFADSSEGDCFDNEFRNREGNCETCSPFCKVKCQDKIGCTSCGEGSYTIEGDQSGRCYPCEEGCLECKDFGTSCVRCNTSTHYQVLDQCYLIPDYCKVKADETGCSECLEGYFLNNATRGKCGSCGEACAKGSSNCDPKGTEGCKAIDTAYEKEHNQEYYIKNGVAMPCPESCEICYEPTKQNAAHDKYKGYEPGCVKCQAHHYVQNSNNIQTCTKCNDICDECSVIAGNCTSCKKGFFLYELHGTNETIQRTCLKKQVGLGCKTFNDDDSCKDCSKGYMLDKGLCIHLNTFACKEYTDANENACKSCNSGYTLVGKNCVKQTANCHEWDKDGKCKVCKDMYYLVDGFCEPCDANCILCDKVSGICNECKPQYYSNATKVCKPMNVEGDSSSIYWMIATNNDVLQCSEGHYVDFDNDRDECRECSAYCEEKSIKVPILNSNDTELKNHDFCDGSYGCTRCKPGFYVSPDGECSSCPVHCSYCDPTLGCLHCLGDTFLDHGRCSYDAASSVFTLLIVLLLGSIVTSHTLY